MGNLYHRKIKKVSRVLVFFILINMMSHHTVWGREKDIEISVGALSINEKTLQSDFQSQAVESFIYDVKDQTAKVTDIWEKGEWSFTIYGAHFTEGIAEVQLIRADDGTTITIDKSDTKVVNENTLLINIKDKNAEKFSSEAYTGSYDMKILYEDGSSLVFENQYEGRSITVTGQDFRPDINQVILKNIKNGAWEIKLEKAKVKYINSSTLNLSLSAADVEKLSGGFNNSDIEMTIGYQSDCIFDEDLREWKFPLIGENFHQGIQEIILRPIAGRALTLPIEEQDIVIERRDISVESDTRLTVYLDKDVLNQLREYNHSGDYKIVVAYSPGNGLPDYTSSMDLKIVYNYGLQTKEVVTVKEKLKFNSKDYLEDSLRFSLLSKSTPKVLEVFPKSSGGYPWINEKDLPHHILEDRSFLRVTFEDIDGKLEFNSLGIEFLLGSSIMAVGSNTEYLDTEFLNMCKENTEYIHQYLFRKDRANKKAYLYIPTKPLSSQGSYVVNIAGKVLINDASENGQLDENHRYSEPISWNFTTMASPSVPDEGVRNQTVIEDYDSDTYIKIYGEFFYSSSIEVFFDDEEAYDVKIKQDSKGDTYLEVYLPRGRRKLEPGLYNIIIQNDDDHTTTTYGTLSILQEGEHIPTEKYKIKSEDSKGEVRSEIHVSHDTIYLRPRYRDNYRVELALDELMGETVWTRNIHYSGNTRDAIGELATKSKYGDIHFYNLMLDRYGDSHNINLRIGRAAPVVIQSLQAKLGNKIAKSSFLEISTENCKWDEIYLSIPYENSSGDNLALYRYDEIRRIWNRENSYVDRVNQSVKGVTKKTGIFVLLQH